MAYLRPKFHLKSEFFLRKKGLRNPSKSSSITSNSWHRWSDFDSDCEAENFEINGVPEGCLPVYVGDEKQRFIVRTELLNHPAFRELLDRSAEEYGFGYEGGIRIACQPVLFERLLPTMNANSDY